MRKKLFQWNYDIKGLIPKQVRLKRKFWLVKNEILFEKKEDELNAYVLGDEDNRCKKRLEPYLWISCLITHNTPELSNGGGVSITSPEKLGTGPRLYASLETHLPEAAVSEIEPYVPKFLRFIGTLHDKYIDVVKENSFLSIALKYFYEAEKISVSDNEGFINAMVCLEALFNDGAFDIKYKLALRAAFLLGLSGFNSAEVFEKLKRLYNFRSTLLHGSGELKYDSDIYSVSGYCRRALMIFMILLKNSGRSNISSKSRKNEILKEIDYAMIDIKRMESLKSEIRKGLKNFRLNIPRTFTVIENGREFRTIAW